MSLPFFSYCGKEEGETNHAERWFETLRARASRVVRKPYCCSRKAENHLDFIHLYITAYNLAVQREATARQSPASNRTWIQTVPYRTEPPLYKVVGVR